MSKMGKEGLEIISRRFIQEDIIGRPDGWRNLCFQIEGCGYAKNSQTFEEYCEHRGLNCPYKDKKGK